MNFDFPVFDGLNAPINDVTPFGETQSAVDFAIKVLGEMNFVNIKYATDSDASVGSFSPQAANSAAYYLATRGYYVYDLFTMKPCGYGMSKDKLIGLQIRKSKCFVANDSPVSEIKWDKRCTPEVCEEYKKSCEFDENACVAAPTTE